MQQASGTEVGAALVAVERANGGELAPLLQVLWTLHSFTPPRSRPSAAEFAASTTHLVEIGVVEYVDNQLGLTPEGRKLLRRSGMPNDPRHVALVAESLRELEERDLEPDGPPAGPTVQDVRQAMSDGDRIQETDGGAGTPVIGEAYSPILGLRSPGPILGPQWVPAVPPVDSGRAAEPPESGLPAGSPAHPFLDRLFARRRRGRDGQGGAGSS
ncbi:MAG: hypothetical protein ACLQBX_12335 [Candidatus Limnocylindrales bacterium]